MLLRSHVAMTPAALLAGMLLLVAGTASGAPLEARDRHDMAQWLPTRAQGGGVEFLLDPARTGKGSEHAWAFLEGAGLRLRLGCTSFDPARARWQFRVEATAPRSDLTGDEETRFTQGVDHILGAAGTLVLIDERDQPMKRLALKPGSGTLASDVLPAEAVRSFWDASALRVETPRLVVETGTLGIFLHLVVNKPGLPCKPE